MKIGTMLLTAAFFATSVTAVAARPKRHVPRSQIKVLVTKKAKQHGIPPALAHGVVKVETGYRCKARGSAGERGVMQVKPTTARAVGVRGNLYNCEVGLEAGMRYLKLALNEAGGDWCEAATLYNRGIHARPTRSAYCRRVMRHAKSEG